MSAIRVGSTFSGIEAASVAFKPLGWETAWVSEIEKFPCEVLAHHYPDVPNHGDVTTLPARIASGEVEAPDVLCGGSPCQAFSVAGLRGGLGDARGALTLTFCEIANAIDTKRAEQGKEPAIIIWENVVGALSVAGNAFGCLLGALAGEDDPLEPAGGKWSNAGCVYGPQRAIAWRVLDAKHFGVAQRRRRLIVVACPLERAHPTQILFECEGSGRDSESSGPQGQVSSGCAEAGAGEDGEGQPYKLAFSLTASDGGADQDSTLLTAQPYSVANCLTRRMHKGINTTLDEGQTPVLAFRVAGDGAAYQTEEHTAPLMTSTDRSSNCVLAYVKGTNPHSADECPTYRETDTAACLTGWDARHNPPKHLVEAQAFQQSQSGMRVGDNFATLDANYGPRRRNGILDGPVVRILMPVEAERLQGFPDGWTDIPGASDTARYKSLGNSWATPVFRWLGARIDKACKRLPQGQTLKSQDSEVDTPPAQVNGGPERARNGS